MMTAVRGSLLFLLAIAGCGVVHLSAPQLRPVEGNAAVCAEYRELVCISTTVRCALDTKRGCQVCQCAAHQQFGSVPRDTP
jgi:hypothetical protein